MTHLLCRPIEPSGNTSGKAVRKHYQQLGLELKLPVNYSFKDVASSKQWQEMARLEQRLIAEGKVNVHFEKR
jgi:hypothetical protein